MEGSWMLRPVCLRPRLSHTMVMILALARWRQETEAPHPGALVRDVPTTVIRNAVAVGRADGL